MEWEEKLRKVSPAGYVFVKRIFERSEQIFNELPKEGQEFYLKYSSDGITITTATLALIAAIGEVSSELFGHICENCGFPNPRFAKFCMNCGVKFPE